MVRGISGPAPIPCSTRNTISASKFQASPQSNDPPVNSARPRAKRFRFPRRFPSQPTLPTNSVREIIYAVIVQDISLSPTRMLAIMVGRARVNASKDSATITAASMMIPATHHL